MSYGGLEFGHCAWVEKDTGMYVHRPSVSTSLSLLFFRGLFCIFPGVFLLSRVRGLCLVTTDWIVARRLHASSVMCLCVCFVIIPLCFFFPMRPARYVALPSPPLEFGIFCAPREAECLCYREEVYEGNNQHSAALLPIDGGG